MPDRRVHATQSGSGWMMSSNQTVAHYFYGDRHSACHQWLRTEFDRPAPGALRCKACTENVTLEHRFRGAS